MFDTKRKIIKSLKKLAGIVVTILILLLLVLFILKMFIMTRKKCFERNEGYYDAEKTSEQNVLVKK